MTQVVVQYNPYRLKTDIQVNGRPIAADSTLYKLTKDKRLQEWVSEFPDALTHELNERSFSLEYRGMALDWDDFEEAFHQAEDTGVLIDVQIRFVETRKDDTIREKIVEIFQDLQDPESPVSDFRDPKLKRAFDAVNNAVFSVNVIATMSSGKSTLINAMLGRKLMPSGNQACTATITEILDDDDMTSFNAIVYGEDDKVLACVNEITCDDMERYNAKPDVRRIAMRGNIPFLDSTQLALQLVDTPGPNSINDEHRKTTYRKISEGSNNLILYVLNATQLQTRDDEHLLEYVSKQIREGGKQIRDRFLFVINKMDAFNPEEKESVENAVADAQEYLSSYGIDDPQIFPCSAFTALNLRTVLKDVDVENLTRAEERMLPDAARQTLLMVDKLNDHESMHLEQYSTLSPSAHKELQERLRNAQERNDIKELALIHSGVCSIEAAIAAYVEKYAKTKKIKDLVDTFYTVLENTQALANAKMSVSSDEQAAEELAKRLALIQDKAKNGDDAVSFRKKIDSLDPLPGIQNKANELKGKVSRQATGLFRHCGDVIKDQLEAQRLVERFGHDISDALAELTVEMEKSINMGVYETGERMLQAYQEKLERFDESAGANHLSFKTADLVRSKLAAIRETANEWTTDKFAVDTVDEYGRVWTETRTWEEKVGEAPEQIVSGSHQKKVGTKKVLVGTHQEYAGKEKYRNPDYKWWNIFSRKYLKRDIYCTVADYKDEDVYETVLDYKTVYRDLFETKSEDIEHYEVKTKDIQSALVSALRENLDDGINGALNYAREEIRSIKEQFTEIFAGLDDQVRETYVDLSRCAKEKEEKEQQLAQNRQILNWLEGNLREIDAVLNMSTSNE